MKKHFIILLLISITYSGNKANAQISYIGEIRMFAGNFAPANWEFCNGQLLSIADNQALFFILGTTYGGNGTTNFALPDMRGRAPVHKSASIVLGQLSGTNSQTLTVSQLPAHSHSVNATTALGNQNVPTGMIFADSNTLDKEFSDAAANTTMKSTLLNPTGGSQPVNNMQPYLGVSYIISVSGIFPTQ